MGGKVPSMLGIETSATFMEDNMEIPQISETRFTIGISHPTLENLFK